MDKVMVLIALSRKMDASSFSRVFNRIKLLLPLKKGSSNEFTRSTSDLFRAAVYTFPPEKKRSHAWWRVCFVSIRFTFEVVSKTMVTTVCNKATKDLSEGPKKQKGQMFKKLEMVRLLHCFQG